MCAQQHERLAHERRQVNHLLVGDQVELIKHGIVLGQILVLVGLLAVSTEHAAIRDDAALLGVLHGEVSGAPLLQLGAGYEAGERARIGRAVEHEPPLVHDRVGRLVDALRLPPVVVVLARYLQDVARLEAQARLCARYEVVVHRVVVK